MRSETIKNWVQMIAIVMAGGWAVYAFIYQNEIVPARNPPNLTASILAQFTGSKDGADAYTLTFTVVNSGTVTAHVLNAIYNASVIKVKQRNISSEDFGLEAKASVLAVNYIRNNNRYYSPTDDRQIVATGRYLDVATVLEPGQSVTNFHTVNIPPDYDMLEITAYLQYAKRTDRVVSIIISHTSGDLTPKLFVRKSKTDYSTTELTLDNLDEYPRFCPRKDDYPFFGENFCQNQIFEHISIMKEDGITETASSLTSSLWR